MYIGNAALLLFHTLHCVIRFYISFFWGSHTIWNGQQWTSYTNLNPSIIHHSCGAAAKTRSTIFEVPFESEYEIYEQMMKSHNLGFSCCLFYLRVERDLCCQETQLGKFYTYFKLQRRFLITCFDKIHTHNRCDV